MKIEDSITLTQAWQYLTGEERIKVSSHPTQGAKATVNAHALLALVARVIEAKRALKAGDVPTLPGP